MNNIYQPDFRPFLGYVEQELEYLSAFDLTCNLELMKVVLASGENRQYEPSEKRQS